MMKKTLSLSLISSAFIYSAVAGETVQKVCRNSLMNLLHQYESKTAENLDMIEFRHNINTREIFGTKTLKLAPVPLLREIFGIYRRPAVARGTRSLFSDAKFIGDIPNEDFIKLLKPDTYYTYVLDDEKIIFAQTRPGKMRDFGSKHAILRDQSHEMHLAGEFYVDKQGKFHFDGASGTFQPPNETTAKGLPFFRDHMGIKNAEVHFFEPPVPQPKKIEPIKIPSYPGVRAVAFINNSKAQNLEGEELKIKDEKGTSNYKLQLAETRNSKEIIYDTADLKLANANSELRATSEVAGTSAEKLARRKIASNENIVPQAVEERTTRVYAPATRNFIVEVDEVRVTGTSGKLKDKSFTRYEYRVTGSDPAIEQIKTALKLVPMNSDKKVALQMLSDL